MPRKDKYTELNSWLMSNPPFVFHVKFDEYEFKALVFEMDADVAVERIKEKYKNLTGATFTCIGKASHILL